MSAASRHQGAGASRPCEWPKCRRVAKRDGLCYPHLEDSRRCAHCDAREGFCDCGNYERAGRPAAEAAR